MRSAKLVATTPVVVVLPPGPAMIGTLWRNIISLGATTASTYLTFRHGHKLVVAARDDAGSYATNGGVVRGPYLEATLQELRNGNPDPQANGMELAGMILVGDEQSVVQ